MGGDFQQYRANVSCGRADCAYTSAISEYNIHYILLLVLKYINYYYREKRSVENNEIVKEKKYKNNYRNKPQSNRNRF